MASGKDQKGLSGSCRSGYYAQLQDVAFMQTVELDRGVVKSIKINVNAMFSLI